MDSLEGLWSEDMEKKRKKKSTVDLSKTMASPSAPPPPVTATNDEARTETPAPVEVKTETPAPVEAKTETPPPVEAVKPEPHSSPALSEASAEAVLAKVELAKVAVPRSSSKLVAAVEVPPDPPARPEPRAEPVEPTPAPAVALTPTPAVELATETPPPVSAAGGPPSKKKASTKKKKKAGDRPSVLPETAREPAVERASKRKIAKAAPAVPKAELDEKLEKLDQKLQEKKVEAEKAARAGFASTPDADDISVPPVDLEEHDHFFAAGEGAAHRASMTGASGSYDAVDPHHARKMTAEAKARRAHLSRYVKGAVIACAAIFLLGLLVSKLRTKEEPTPAVQVTHAPLPTPPPPLPSPTPTDDTVAPSAVASASAAPDTSASAAASAAPDTSASAAASAAPDTSAKPAKTALQEKLDAKALLEREAYGAAVAAGERSVALDATDGEAWLILGAAYQGMGNAGQAKRCYQTCTKQKRGPISDCQQMLQQ
jgi:hypothetical protein